MIVILISCFFLSAYSFILSLKLYQVLQILIESQLFLPFVKFKYLYYWYLYHQDLRLRPHSNYLIFLEIVPLLCKFQLFLVCFELIQSGDFTIFLHHNLIMIIDNLIIFQNQVQYDVSLDEYLQFHFYHLNHQSLNYYFIYPFIFLEFLHLIIGCSK